MTNIYKLRYESKDQGIADLLSRGILIEAEEGHTYGEGVHAVVELGVITLESPTFDDDGNQLTPGVYADGYHFDLMIEQAQDFDPIEIHPTNPKHQFA